MISTLRKILRFGFSGVVAQLKAWPGKLLLRRTLLARIQKGSSVFGVTIIAPLSRPASLCKAMRDFVAKLREANIPYQTFDCEHLENNDASFVLNKYTHIIGMLGTPALPAVPGVTYSEVIFWEFEDGVTAAYPHLLDPGKTIIAMSDFNATCYRQELPPSIPVVKVNYPLVLTHTKATLPPVTETRKKFGIPPDAFAVFFNVGIGSNRKNPEGCIRAFAEAFADRNDTYLVFKVMHAKRFPEIYNGLLLLATQLGIKDRFITITDYITEEDVYALTNACDCYLSLHRGEGFGLGVAEAMSLGKPVIVTDYSSTAEFCNANNSIPVPYTMTKPVLSEFDKTVYGRVSLWAEPDIHAAASALRKLYDKPDFRARIGKAAEESIAHQFSTDAFRRSMLAFLKSCAILAK